MASMDIDFGIRPRASDGVHFANIGGMWQEIVLGFGGMVNALGTDVLTFKPCMPKEFNSISFKIIWKGQLVAVNVDKETVTLKNLSDEELNVKVADKPLTISAGSDRTVEYRKVER
jgi:trehalose/maltose hydrolase-like predicted phosphorylase